MIGHGQKLGRKQEQAISALLQRPTITDAAKAIGVGEATLWRWMKQADFKRAYLEARREVVTKSIARLQQASGEAVEALREVMEDRGAPASARVAAARVILETALKSVEVEDLAVRVDTLEQKREMK